MDDDGYLDLIVANWGGPLSVFHNRLGALSAHHWLAVEVRGDGVRVNRDGFWTIVELVRPDGSTDVCFRTPMPSMSATGDAACLFGLGDEGSVMELWVHWPDGTSERFDVPQVDGTLEVVRAK